MAVEDIVKTHPTLALIGNTPMVEIVSLRAEFPEARVFAKMEAYNPGGSLKDRPVARILADALDTGELRPGMTILDSSSGNAGITYAMVGSILGYPVEIVMPENVSEERKRRIRAHGARITFTDPIAGYDEAMREVRRLYESDPETYYFADQYGNDSNWRAHFEGTAPEILLQAPTGFTHFVAGVGTGGTITGVGRRLKQERPEVEVVSAVPPAFPGVEGLKPLGPDHIMPEILDRSVVDRWVEIDVDEARRESVGLARQGIFAGQSSGAYIYAVREVLLDEPRAVVVTLICDTGDRYFTSGLWDE